MSTTKHTLQLKWALGAWVDVITTRYILGSMSNEDTTVMSVKVKKSLKVQAQAVAGQYGIPLGTLLNAYMHQLVLTGQIYFPPVEIATPEMEKTLSSLPRTPKPESVPIDRPPR